MKIKTNNQPRHLLTNNEGETYFVYKGEEYNLDDFIISDSIPGFHATLGTSYFTAIAVRMVGTDSVVVAYVHW